MDGTDGITIALGATTTGLLVRKAAAWLRARNQRTEIAPPDPMHVQSERKPVYVSVAEFNRRMDETNARVTRIEGEIKANNERVMQKLDEIDARNEERAKSTHARIDPLIEKIGSIRGKIEYIEKAAPAATVGGKK